MLFKQFKFSRKLPKRRSFLYGLKKKKCTECLKCEEACPTKAIDLITFPESMYTQPIHQAQNLREKSIYKFYIDFARCTHCHACIKVCETEALFAYQGETQATFEKRKLKKDLMIEKYLHSDDF